MDSIDIQTQINATYREAIVSVLTQANHSLDREELNMAVLGGMEAAELPRWILEPYTPALAQLVEKDVIIQYQDFSSGEGTDDYGIVRYCLRDRATDEQRQNADEIREEQPHHNWNDPSNWRTNIDDAVEQVVVIRKGLVIDFLARQAMLEIELADDE